jgi:transcriptional regulator with XRE-family HTH domain
MSEIDATRARFLGKLIQDAREGAGVTSEECAKALGISLDAYAQAEQGELPLSLPQLEVLALVLNLPMAYFWSGKQLPEDRLVDYAQYMILRQRIIGVALQQARIDAGWSIQRLADESDVATEQIESFERGQEPIPYLLLESLADLLDAPLNVFTVEQSGPLGRHEQALTRRENFEALPEEVQAFVADPGNLIYLQTAMRLSDMDVDRLRGIAEGILDITF